MNKFFISALLLTAIALPSCSDDSLEPVSSPSPISANGVQVSVNATIEGSQNIAKTHLAYDDALEAKVYKFDGSESMAFYCGSNTSDKSVLSIVSVGANLQTAVFRGAIFNEKAGTYYGVVPESAASGVDGDGKIRITLPSEQTVDDGAQYDPKAHIVASKSEDYSSLTLKTANSFLLLTIPDGEERTFKSIELTSLGGENIAGTVLYDPVNCTFEETDGMSKSVKIKGEFTGGSSVYISLLPCTLSKGFKLMATDSDNKLYKLVCSSEVSFKRNSYNKANSDWKTGLYTLEALKWDEYINKYPQIEKIVFGTNAPAVSPDLIIDDKLSLYIVNNEPNIELYYVSKSNICLAGSLEDMFCVINGLTEVDLSNINTSEVTDMKNMFAGDESLTLVNLGDNFNTENVTDMFSMFYNCTSLTSLDLGPNFITSKVTNMDWMFYGCENLERIEVATNFDIGALAYEFNELTYMFDGCNNLIGEKGSKITDEDETKEPQYARIDGSEGKPGYFTKRSSSN